MKVKDIKEWVNNLPDDMLEYDVLCAESYEFGRDDVFFNVKSMKLISLNELNNDILFIT